MSDPDILLNSVFITRLIPYLSPLCYIMLRRAYPRFFLLDGGKRYPTPAQLCYARCDRMFRDTFALSPSVSEELMCSLMSGKLTLTGGALLSLIRGEPIDGTTRDFDLAYFEPMVEGSAPIAFSTTVCKDTALESLVDDDDPSYDHLTWRNLWVYKIYFAGGAEASLMRFTTQESLRNFPAYFDMSFCSNILSADRLLIRDIYAVLFRRCTLDPNVYLRGLDLNDEEHRIRNAIRTKVCKRLTKYHARGYEISMAVDWAAHLDANAIRDCGIWLPKSGQHMRSTKYMTNEECTAYFAAKVAELKPVKRRAVFEAFKRIWAEEVKKL